MVSASLYSLSWHLNGTLQLQMQPEGSQHGWSVCAGRGECVTIPTTELAIHPNGRTMRLWVKNRPTVVASCDYARSRIILGKTEVLLLVFVIRNPPSTFSFSTTFSAFSVRTSPQTDMSFNENADLTFVWLGQLHCWAIHFSKRFSSLVLHHMCPFLVQPWKCTSRT